jgi:hypothetical protein
LPPGADRAQIFAASPRHDVDSHALRKLLAKGDHIVKGQMFEQLIEQRLSS